MKISARNALIGVVATAAVTLSAGTAQATHANSCTVNYSGVDARRNCGYHAVFHTNGYLYMSVSGVAFAVVTCNGLQVASSGLRSSGTYVIPYNPFGIQLGGTCLLETGVNGSLYAFAN